VIRPGSRYAIVKVTNGTMTTHVAETQDNIDVYTDGKGNYSLEVLPSLGVECLWVHGAGWTEDQIYE
jgi:oxalate decarboxylase/phosphoglucose isomerase-like protein (cupin superfamily)